ncbi:hypothetical protein F4677DRAFT_51323 [Hypoxylon crocopeplum]|nr:hypothetical protein F4677DRAFT_51323 [Hypoxylon crocopeplum]
MASSSRTSPALPIHNIKLSKMNSNTSQTSATPYQPQQPVEQSQQPIEQPQTYSTMFDRVSNARREAGDAFDDFYTDEDVKNYSPKGWPSIASTQMFYPNFNSHRGFRSLTHNVLTDYEQKIHCIEDRLDEINFEDAEDEDRPLRTLPFDREQFIARCVQGTAHLPLDLSGLNARDVDRATERYNLMTTLGIFEREYFSLLHMQHENMKFARVSRRAHEVHFKTARDWQGLSNSAIAFMRYMDDFLSIEPDYVFMRFESLIYTNYNWLVKLLQHVCCITESKEADDPRIAYGLRGFELLFRALLELASLSLLLVPVSMLYLGVGWSRAQYLAVVVVAAVIFGGAMTAFEPRTAHLLVGLTAFFAVLVTFLSNLPSCNAA